MSREELATQIGMDVATVKRLEQGSGSVRTLLAAMKALEFHLTGVARGSTLIDQIVNKRRNLQMTSVDLAKRAGISRQTLARLEGGAGTVAPLIKVLAVLARRGRPAKPVRASWNYDRASDRDKRFTPSWFLDHVVTAFGPIDLDPCGHELSLVRAKRTILLPEDGLKSSWSGTRLAFVNPPFSNLVCWLNRAIDAYEKMECEKVVILIPTRTDSATFHDRLAPVADIAFIKGRMKFDVPEGPAYPAPFAMMTCIMGGEPPEVRRFADLVPSTWLPATTSAKRNKAGLKEAVFELNDGGSATATVARSGLATGA